MPSPILVEPLQWNDTHVQILEMILGYISGHRNTEEEKMVKSFHKIIVLCMAILCFHGCGEKINYWEIENPFIRFVNQSDDTVWVEVLNDKEFIHHFKGTINKSNQGNYESNIFDKDEMDPTFKRFQLGWQLGFDFQYRKFVLGWGYGIDFNKVWQNTRVNSLALNLGYRF